MRMRGTLTSIKEQPGFPITRLRCLPYRAIADKDEKSVDLKVFHRELRIRVTTVGCSQIFCVVMEEPELDDGQGRHQSQALLLQQPTVRFPDRWNAWTDRKEKNHEVRQCRQAER